jgi:hypothetical protein
MIDDYLPLQKVFPLLGDTLAGLDRSESDDDDASSTSTLTVHYPEIDENGALLPMDSSSPVSTGLDWTVSLEKRTNNPLSCAFDGVLFEALGCFPIGLHASKQDFDHVLKSQRRLRSLKLLSRYTAEQLHVAAATLSSYVNRSCRAFESVLASRDAISHLVEALSKTTDETDDPYQLQVYSGLDSGFHTPAGGQFWSVWEVEPRTRCVIMYVSKSVQDLAGVLLHTHLSRMGFARYDCFLVEYGLSEFRSVTQSSGRLPARLNQDLELLSTSDILLELQHLQFSEWDNDCPLLLSLRKRCEELLIEVPTYQQFKRLSNMDYISGAITDEQLAGAKLKWYRLCGNPGTMHSSCSDMWLSHLRISCGGEITRSLMQSPQLSRALQAEAKLTPSLTSCSFVSFAPQGKLALRKFTSKYRTATHSSISTRIKARRSLNCLPWVLDVKHTSISSPATSAFCYPRSTATITISRIGSLPCGFSTLHHLRRRTPQHRQTSIRSRKLL